MEIYSKFDICWGYNNIRIREEDQWKAAFKTSRGLFEPKVMFFGMSNSPGAFQRFINHILEPWYQKYGCKKGKNYMDDISITMLASEAELHIVMTNDLFNILAEHGLHLKLSKSIFMQPHMDFLGMRIGKDGVTIDSAKIAGITEWPEELTTVKGVRAVLGIIGYLRMFIPRFSFLAAPLTHLTGKDIPFEWTDKCRQAVCNLKKAVTTAPVLVRPDPSKQFELEVDTSRIVMILGPQIFIFPQHLSRQPLHHQHPISRQAHQHQFDPARRHAYRHQHQFNPARRHAYRHPRMRRHTRDNSRTPGKRAMTWS
jgi:hypothetical protein